MFGCLCRSTACKISVVNLFHTLSIFFRTASIATLAICAISTCLPALSAHLSRTIPSQQNAPSAQEAISVNGTIRDGSGKAVSDATVMISETEAAPLVKTKSNADGSFRAILRKAGTYRIRAEKAGIGSAAADAIHLELGDAKRCDLVLSPAPTTPGSSSASESAAGFEFKDE